MTKRGFTLIELLAVIAVLATLIIISVPAISKVLKTGRDQAKEVNYDTVLNAAYDYVLNNPDLAIPTTVTIEELQKKGLLKEDTRDGNGDLLNKLDYVRIEKVEYESGKEYKRSNMDKYVGNYHFTYVKVTESNISNMSNISISNSNAIAVPSNMTPSNVTH